MGDLKDFNFWKSIKIDSTITLSDKETIEESIDRKEGIKPVEFLVSEINLIREMKGIANWLFLHLVGKENLILIIRQVDGSLDYRVMFEVEDFKQGNRADMLNREMFWLFQEPEDPDDFELDELKFTVEITMNEDSKENVYYQNSETEFYGRNKYNRFAVVSEYVCKKDCKYSELVLLEIGGEDGDEGGLIIMYMGNQIKVNEIEVLSI